MKTLEHGVIGKPNGSATLTPRKQTNRRAIIVLIILVIAIVAAAGMFIRARNAARISYITTSVLRKDLVHTVTATGTVNPQNTILVGTQVSGTVQEQDADYNDVVKKNQVLTRLDPTSFKAALENLQAAESQAQSTYAASLASANSARQNVVVAQQNAQVAREALASARTQVAKAKAALDLADVTVRRDRELLAQGFIAQSQSDTDSSNAVAAKSAYEAAVIAVGQAQSQLQSQIAAQGVATAQARAADSSSVAANHAVDVQRAAVAQAQYNYDNTIIRSQVKGTVIARNITIGQTVAASFQTPTLFTIGQDLTKMQVDVAVGEPDIGGVRAGDIADFTVLAYPNRTFRGYVFQVRQNPTTVNNVVTYDTVVYVQNKDGSLYPGMTANASIHVAKVMHGLVVPIAALQWSPPESQRRQPSAGTPISPWGLTEASITRTIVAGRDGRVFVLRSGKPTYVPVRVELVADTEATVSPTRGGLSAGDAVITADTSSQMAAQQAAATSALTRPTQSLGRSSGGGR